jgi:prepilin-type N-terminal cleavage/methylation domain-containing protein
MKRQIDYHSSKRGFTLLEMTVVIMVLLSLISTGLFVSRKMDDWRRGREAAETLRAVYSAQRMFLADNPTRAVSSLTSAELVPYLPMGGTSMPTVKSLTNANLSIKFDVSPPVVNAGTGTTYDPSGSSTDSLWDVGE